MYYAKVTFTRGSGLGNRLFPWARAKIYCQQYDMALIFPTWAHFRTATLRMGGIDYSKFFRKVLLWDTFEPQREEISGFRKMQLLRSARRLEESKFIPRLQNENVIVEFLGMGRHFADLHNARTLLDHELRCSIKAGWRNYIDALPAFDIAINVRLGNDFLAIGHTPLQWYIDTLARIDSWYHQKLSCVVISDGTYEQLKPLLQRPNIEFLSTPASVTDLYALTKSRLLLGSGGSSFTAWAAFLGSLPTFIHPGKTLDYFKINHGNPTQYIGPLKEIDFMGEAKP